MDAPSIGAPRSQNQPSIHATSCGKNEAGEMGNGVAQAASPVSFLCRHPDWADSSDAQDAPGCRKGARLDPLTNA
jgi:hypothetical protein